MLDKMEFPLVLKGERVGNDTWRFALILGDESIAGPVLQEVNVGDWIPARAAQAFKKLLKETLS